MLTINIKITFIVVILTPLLFLLQILLQSIPIPCLKLQSETRGEQTSLIEEMIGNVKVVQAFSYQEEALKKFDEINERLEKILPSCCLLFVFDQSFNPFINSLFMRQSPLRAQ